jgi:hypothetical protein
MVFDCTMSNTSHNRRFDSIHLFLLLFSNFDHVEFMSRGSCLAPYLEFDSCPYYTLFIDPL